MLPVTRALHFLTAAARWLQFLDYVSFEAKASFRAAPLRYTMGPDWCYKQLKNLCDQYESDIKHQSGFAGPMGDDPNATDPRGAPMPSKDLDAAWPFLEARAVQIRFLQIFG